MKVFLRVLTIVVCITMTVTVIPVFAENEKVSAIDVFDDLVPGSWYISGICFCYDRNIMEGVGNNRFEPNAPLTREQVAMMLYKYLKEDETYTSYSFTDVKAGAWYADAVEWMYQNGYTAGISEDEYGVGRYITRQDLMTLVYNVIFREYYLAGEYYYKDTIKNFADAGDISDYAFISMSFAAGLSWSGMCRGSGEGEIEPILYGNNGTIKPKDICTRAEAAAIFKRTFYADCFSPVSVWTHPTS